jgi:hypothetical protein
MVPNRPGRIQLRGVESVKKISRAILIATKGLETNTGRDINLSVSNKSS